jgi:MinD superfamily P-loop ATPase
MTNGTARVYIELIIDDRVCRACGRCLAKEVCRGDAIRIIDKGEAPFLDLSRCWGCQVCVSECPFGAIMRREIPV